jgi:hypothetical protein
VAVNASKVFEHGLRGQPLAKSARILLRPENATHALDVGGVSLTELAKHEQQVDALLAELNGILAKGGDGMSKAEILRSYELYERARRLAWHDPRFSAAAARFWELLYGRKQDEARERLEKNLQALEKARGVLSTAGLAAIPVYAQAAANAAQVDPQALEWARWELLTGLRQHPAACQSFSFTQLPSYGFGPSSLFAAHHLHFAYGSGYQAAVVNLCSRMGGF